MGTKSVARAAMVLALLATVACGDPEPPPLATAVSSGSGSSSANGGAGGSSGDGAGGAGSDGGAGGAGGSIEFLALNGCDPDNLVDLTGGDAIILFGYLEDPPGSGTYVLEYKPKCAKVDANANVLFRCGGQAACDFSVHPLQDGTKPAAEDSGDPFGFTGDESLTEKLFSIAEPGSYAYVCVAHISNDMIGALYVQ